MPHLSNPHRRLAALAVSVLAMPVVLSGCASHSEDHYTVGSIPTQYQERHPIVIGEKEHTLDIPVARGMDRLPIANESAIENIAFRYRRAGASGFVTVMLPSGSPNEAAGRAIGRRVIEVLRASRVPANRIRTVTYRAIDHGNSAPIRVSYHAVSASVTGCGEWPVDLARENTQNTQYHNFGCATQSNLATIVANPSDLLGPRGMSDIDASRRNNVIDDWRAGEVQIEGGETGATDRVLTKPAG